MGELLPVPRRPPVSRYGFPHVAIVGMLATTIDITRSRYHHRSAGLGAYPNHVASPGKSSVSASIYVYPSGGDLPAAVCSINGIITGYFLGDVDPCPREW